MSMFNKGMKIGEGQKYDLTQVSTEGLSAEDIEKMDKKARKLIDIYNTDGKAGLSQIELARAMDGFASADANGDGKITNKELDEYAKMFNEERGLTGDKAIAGKDLKSLLKEVRKFTKGDEKASTAVTIDDGAISDWAKENGFEAVEGHPDVYQKDGKYTMIVRGDELLPVRAKLDGDNFRAMTQEEFDAEQAQEHSAEIARKAEEGGYKYNEEKNVYTQYAKDGSNLNFVYDNEKNDFVRAKYDGDNDKYVAMTQEEIDAEDTAIQQTVRQAQERVQRQQDLETPKDYTVQNGESLTSILRRSLKGQGKEVNAENLAEAKAEFVRNNPKALHGARGREYLYAGDVVKVAGGLEDKANTDEIRSAAQQRQQRVRQQREEAANDDNIYYGRELQKVVVVGKRPKAKATKPANTPQGPQPIKLNGADPDTGKLGNKDFTSVNGKGMCKYNPEIKGYELYSGTYGGKYYENGQVKTIATKKPIAYTTDKVLHSNKYTYHYANGSLTSKHVTDPTYDYNVQIKIGNKTFELANGNGWGYAHTDFHDFVEKFVDEQTGAIRAKSYESGTYYLKSGDTQYPVKIDKQTKALMVEINGKKYDMNDFMSGKLRLN